MKTVITWLWIVPLPLTFALELLTGSGWLLTVANVFALATALPILVRSQRRTARGEEPSTGMLALAALALLLSLVPVALATTLSLTVLWLSMVTVVMLARWFAAGAQLLMLILLSVGSIVTPALMWSDGLTFAFGASTVIVASLALGLLLRMVDRSLIERHATAVEAERRRMATELHDLVAHEVTGIIVLSQAAARSEDAGVLTTALGKIEESGTRALEQIRALVSNAPANSSARSPIASGIQALRDRADGFEGASSLTLDVDDTVTEVVPSSVWPVLDRVLAEALTNIRRHAGAGVPVMVRVSTAASARPEERHVADIALTVINGPGPGGIGTGSGTGLRGLRARVDHLGGSLLAGPGHDGGWVLEARIPLNPTADE
ncbi:MULTISPECIES: sensor histidine kinase [Brevibacterium]|uniref:histidine kinase n=1 Tax=Brevibacterium sandarakinum TaxID=629680 RepID=A0A1H1LIA9_BRESA|nr:histidine kinase [Brevibacterium sandarakinum]SDR74060.1 Signal transduction histidine kinase [Brevibacterium sandarakinum]